MPTMADLEGTLEDPSHDQEDEHEDEIFYETVEDVELDDDLGSSFVSEEEDIEDEASGGAGSPSQKKGTPPTRKIVLEDEEFENYE